MLTIGVDQRCLLPDALHMLLAPDCGSVLEGGIKSSPAVNGIWFRLKMNLSGVQFWLLGNRYSGSAGQ